MGRGSPAYLLVAMVTAQTTAAAGDMLKRRKTYYFSTPQQSTLANRESVEGPEKKRGNLEV